MSEHSKDANTFAAVTIASVRKERGTQAGKIFCHVTGEMAGDGVIYDGLIHLAGGVYRVGMMAEGETLYGHVTEHRSLEQQKQDFMDDLTEAGLSPERAEAARREVQAAIKQAPAPREITISTAKLEAIADKIKSGQASSALELLNRILIT